MTDEYIDLSVYALTGWLLYILHLTYIQKYMKCVRLMMTGFMRYV